MTRPPALRFVVALLAAALLSFPAVAVERVEGTAHDREDGRVLYRETHWRLRGADGLSRVVLYRCPDGTPFARKRLWGDPDAVAPRFEFLDGRDGYREGVRAVAGGLEVFWRERSDAPERRAPAARTASTVFDAGFDALVRTGFPTLLGGTPLRAAFLVPSRQDTVGIRIAPVAGPDDGTLRLRMSVDAWYGFVAPRTDLAYTRADRRLRRFEGVGTIRDGRGRHLDVRIEFPPDGRRDGVPPAEVDAALVAPLARACTR